MWATASCNLLQLVNHPDFLSKKRRVDNVLLLLAHSKGGIESLIKEDAAPVEPDATEAEPEAAPLHFAAMEVQAQVSLTAQGKDARTSRGRSTRIPQRYRNDEV